MVSNPDIKLALLDWIVLIAYGIGMLYIGWHFSRQNKTQEDYLLGGRKMNPTAVGISLFASLLSTLSYLTYPGEMIQHGPAIFAGMLAFPLVYYIAGWWLIPRIMEMNVTSAYEILELKLGISVRMLATFMFLSLRLLWMATIIYVTVDVALLSVIQFDRAWVPVIGMFLTIITIIYTSMGGLKAVVFTDVVQSGIFMGGALLSILVVGYQFGFGNLFPTSWPDYWDTLKLGFDPQERTTLGNAVLVLFVWYICTTGSDQMAVQRYLSTKDIKTARRSFLVSLFSSFISYVLLAMVGLAMLVYFTNNESLLMGGQTLQEQADTLFPRFILIALPPGVSGLIIAGLIAAAMSSMSSGLNSVSSVISEDIIKRFRRSDAPKMDLLKQAKLLSYFTGVIVILLSFFVGAVQGNLLDVVMKVVNLFVAPLFVLFFMALFVSFATERGTFWGGIFSIVAAVAVAFYEVLGITVLWIMSTSLVAGIIAAVLLSLLDRQLFKRAT